MRSRVGRAVVVVIALLGACSVGSGEAADEPAVERDRPNIIVVITDDQTVAMMAGLPETTRLLGDDGTTFTRASVTMPLCCPARASMLTGQLPHSNGVRDNVAPDGGFSQLDWSRTVATELQDAGYRTAHVGRTLNDYTIDAQPLVPEGWDEWYTPLEDNTRSFIARGASMVANGELVTLSPLTHTDEALGEIALGLVDEWVDGDEPFYLELGSVAPHTARMGPSESVSFPVPADADLDTETDTPRPPVAGPDEPGKPAGVDEQPDVDADTLDRYWARALESLHSVDRIVSSLVARLDRAGALDDTVVMFTSDNGIALGDHGLGLDKVTPYESSVTVPLIVRGPGFDAETIDLPVSQVDVAPTLLAAAGLDVPSWMEGVPLQETLAEPETAADRVLSVESPPTPRPEPPFFQVRWGDLVLTRYDTGEAELSDLAEDPDQLTNLIDDPAYADAITTLDRAATVLRDCTGRSCLVYEEGAP